MAERGDPPDPTPRARPDDPIDDPIDVVARWHERAWGDCDLSVVDELVTEPFVRHGVGGTTKRTRADLKADLCEYRKALGKPVVEVHDRVADGDRVWSRTSMRGAHFRTGEPRVIHLLQIHRVRDGQISEVWTLHATDVDWED